ncbi:hypothetical protein ACROYT_G036289 [Oculina patagonica]
MVRWKGSNICARIETNAFSTKKMFLLLFLIMGIEKDGSLAMPECGLVVNNTLKSPGYPSNYPDEMDCSYTVPIPDGTAMEINFHDFNLEEDELCRWDYLLISNDQGRIFGKYCSDWTGKVILVTGNYTVITFKTDAFGQETGFLLNFTVVSLECGSVVNNSLKSPGYPNNYPNNVECVYSVPIPQGTEMSIDFSDFGLEYTADCV